MKTVFKKEDIKKFSLKTLECLEEGNPTGEIYGDTDESSRNDLNTEFEENAVYYGNCFDGFFEEIKCCRFGNILFAEVQKLGDDDGYYKDWSMKKYMQTMQEICDQMDGVLVSSYDYFDDAPEYRAFSIAFLFDINEYKYYEEVYKYCHEFCDQLEILIDRKIRGCYWDKLFETDEMAFCNFYLTPFFKKLGFEQVIFNHGNHEFGKDYILVCENLFGEKEYYGVQAKAGNMSGTATSDINEIKNQIDIGFDIPYEFVDGRKIFISKIIIAISGNYTENAKTIIQNKIEKYKFTNIIFLSKK